VPPGGGENDSNGGRRKSHARAAARSHPAPPRCARRPAPSRGGWSSWTTERQLPAGVVPDWRGRARSARPKTSPPSSPGLIGRSITQPALAVGMDGPVKPGHDGMGVRKVMRGLPPAVTPPRRATRVDPPPRGAGGPTPAGNCLSVAHEASRTGEAEHRSARPKTLPPSSPGLTGRSIKQPALAVGMDGPVEPGHDGDGFSASTSWIPNRGNLLDMVHELVEPPDADRVELP